MKALKLMLLAAILIPLHLFGETTDTTGKLYFYQAKQELENMLSGKKKMSYEEAIYQVENAWYGGVINHATYEAVLGEYTKDIFQLAVSYADGKKLNPQTDFDGTTEQKRDKYTNALLNYSIYRFMTSPTMCVKDGKIAWHEKYSYSTKDPMGTSDWSNTQVIHLINKNSGNCFALASLYKILADRLNAESKLCTAPGHIYIRNADDKGTYYNVELSAKSFPGTGTIETLTYTTGEAAKNNISLRELDLEQSISLCLVYLAKGYEYKFGIKDDNFILTCSETALRYDDHNLNAMLLKAEVLENRLVKQGKDISKIKTQKNFREYQEWITHIYKLGYREMPFEMKNRLIKGWTQDTVIELAKTSYSPLRNSKIKPIRYASLSWGLFDEEIRTKPFERFGNTVYDTKRNKIIAFLREDILYNQYNFDPVVFAWNIDPMAHKFPGQSPYSAFGDNPIFNIDVGGEYQYPANKAAAYKKAYPMITVYLSKYVQKDVQRSQTVQNGILNHDRGGYTRDELVNHVTAWGDKSSPEISFSDDIFARGHTSDAKHFQINATFAKAIESILENKDASEKDKQAAITKFYETIIDETTHTGDSKKNGNGGKEGEVGADARNEIFHTKEIMKDENGKDVPILYQDDDDPSNGSLDLTGTKSMIERKTKEGKADVIPTVPKKE